MNFTYDNPKESQKDFIRLRLGDTVQKPYSLFDEEIECILESTPSMRMALIKCCEIILAKLADKVSYKLGPESVSMSDSFDNYRRLLKDLKATSTNIPVASVTAPRFTIGMHDNV